MDATLPNAKISATFAIGGSGNAAFVNTWSDAARVNRNLQLPPAPLAFNRPATWLHERHAAIAVYHSATHSAVKRVKTSTGSDVSSLPLAHCPALKQSK